MEIQIIRELLEKQGVDWDKEPRLLEHIQESCFEIATLENEEIWRVHRELGEKTEDLGFLRQDGILCLSNELCYHYARHAFSEGFYTGLRLVAEIGTQR